MRKRRKRRRRNKVFSYRPCVRSMRGVRNSKGLARWQLSDIITVLLILVPFPLLEHTASLEGALRWCLQATRKAYLQLNFNKIKKLWSSTECYIALSLGYDDWYRNPPITYRLLWYLLLINSSNPPPSSIPVWCAWDTNPCLSKDDFIQMKQTVPLYDKVSNFYYISHIEF